MTTPVRDILNSSFCDSRLSSFWKEADIVPVPKQRPISDVKSNFDPYKLTPILSKIAEDYVVNVFVKPAVLKKINDKQFGTIPTPRQNECAGLTHARIVSTHEGLVPIKFGIETTKGKMAAI